jgi:hypothetical protein
MKMILFFRWINYLLSTIYFALIGQSENDPKNCKHSWWVHSTAIEDVTLEVVCIKCETHGAVYGSTSEEWSKAYDAPDCPYRWHKPARVKFTVQEK